MSESKLRTDIDPANEATAYPVAYCVCEIVQEIYAFYSGKRKSAGLKINLQEIIDKLHKQVDPILHGRIDMTLKLNGKVMVVVELKNRKTFSHKRSRLQLSAELFEVLHQQKSLGPKVGILTNGNQWAFASVKLIKGTKKADPKLEFAVTKTYHIRTMVEMTEFFGDLLSHLLPNFDEPDLLNWFEGGDNALSEVLKGSEKRADLVKSLTEKLKQQKVEYESYLDQILAKMNMWKGLYLESAAKIDKLENEKAKLENEKANEKAKSDAKIRKLENEKVKSGAKIRKLEDEAVDLRNKLAKTTKKSPANRFHLLRSDSDDEEEEA